VATRGLTRRWPAPSASPGFPLAFGLTLTYLSAIVVIPLAALVLKPWSLGVAGCWHVLSDPRVLSALRLSFRSATLAALVDAVLGTLIGWTLVRYQFPGRRLLDAIVDLPFALPTAVAGIALTALYAPNGVLGGLAALAGIKTAYSQLGIFIALVFVGLPFVVRAIEPVLGELDQEIEEAARTLGATDLQRVAMVVAPALIPALISGVGLAFARGLGEYGSVIFIAGNMPMRTEIAPLLIVIKLEEFDYAGAALIGLAMVVMAFGTLLAVNALQTAFARRGAV
jgi:sulfate transport system permease protein